MSVPGARRAARKRPRWVPALAAAASVAALALGGGAVYSALSGTGTPTAREPGPSSSAPAPHDDSTTFGFRPGKEATLSAGNFADQVDGLLERRQAPSPSPSKSFGTKQVPGIVAPGVTERCVRDRLKAANAGRLLATRPAKLDGKMVTLALTETGKAGVVRAYAIDCGLNGKIVRSATITDR